MRRRLTAETWREPDSAVMLWRRWRRQRVTGRELSSEPGAERVTDSRSVPTPTVFRCAVQEIAADQEASRLSATSGGTLLCVHSSSQALQTYTVCSMPRIVSGFGANPQLVSTHMPSYLRCNSPLVQALQPLPICCKPRIMARLAACPSLRPHACPAYPDATPRSLPQPLESTCCGSTA